MNNSNILIMKHVYRVLFFFCFLIVMISCRQDTQGEGPAQQHEILTIAYANWPENVAFTYLAKVALEEKGYEVELKLLPVASIYATLAKGESDLFLDAWLPHTHAAYWDHYGDHLQKLGISFKNGKTGLVVPQYLEIYSITQLNDYVQAFNGNIYGLEKGTGIFSDTEEAIEQYGLNFDQLSRTNNIIMEKLEEACNNRDPILFSGWRPHPSWANYELKFLNDPKGIYQSDQCYIVSRKGFTKDFPEVSVFFKNFSFTNNELRQLMILMQQSEDYEKHASEWYKKKKPLIKNWWNKKTTSP